MDDANMDYMENDDVQNATDAITNLMDLMDNRITIYKNESG